MNNDLWKRNSTIEFVLNGANTIIPYGVIVFDVTSKTLRIGDGCTCGGVGYIEVTPTCPVPEKVMERAAENQIKMEADANAKVALTKKEV